MDIEYQTEKALHAYKTNQYDTALEAALILSKHNVQVGHYLCGLIYELGVSAKGQNFALAYKSFEFLAKGFDDDEGFLGCARVIFKEKDINKTSLAITHCMKAIDLTGNQFAYLLLGDIYQELIDPPELGRSKQAYYRAAIHGAGWGWRRLAFLESKQKHLFRAVFLHILATLISPLYFIFGGSRAMREG